MSEFLAMGGYAAFVWPSYLIAAIVMLGLLVVSVRTWRDSKSTLEKLQDGRRDRRRPRDGAT